VVGRTARREVVALQQPAFGQTAAHDRSSCWKRSRRSLADSVRWLNASERDSVAAECRNSGSVLMICCPGRRRSCAEQELTTSKPPSLMLQVSFTSHQIG
jgi:hypothetical protein